MASSKEYLEFVLEQLDELEGISYRAMMGEYIIYYNGKVIGGIYDDRFLVKSTKSLLDSGLKQQIPYPSAKPMLLIDSEDPDEIKEIVLKIIKDLK